MSSAKTTLSPPRPAVRTGEQVIVTWLQHFTRSDPSLTVIQPLRCWNTCQHLGLLRSSWAVACYAASACRMRARRPVEEGHSGRVSWQRLDVARSRAVRPMPFPFFKTSHLTWKTRVRPAAEAAPTVAPPSVLLGSRHTLVGVQEGANQSRVHSFSKPTVGILAMQQPQWILRQGLSIQPRTPPVEFVR